jgi:hypothetical protein
MRSIDRIVRAARFAAIAVAGLLCAGPATAQIHDAISNGLEIDDFTFMQLDVPQELGPHALIPVTFNGKQTTMTLFRNSLRSPDFEVILSDGSKAELPPLHTYRGMLNGVRGSRVSASLYGGQLNALIKVGDTIWGIQPATQADPAADPGLHVLYRAEDFIGDGGTCGVLDFGVGHEHDEGDVTPAGGGTKITEIAFDCDYEFFLANGQSVQNTIANTENIVNGMANIYLSNVNIGYEITTIIVRDNPADPYTTTDPESLLNQFRNEWQTNQAGVHRDVAHLMTAKNLTGSIIGIAYLNGVCKFSLGYGLSQTTFTNNFAVRVALTCHEVGHNFSAQHCDGQNDCAIMCSGIGGCPGGISKFSNIAKAQINNYANAIGCLEIIPDETATWKVNVTTTNGDNDYQVGEIATIKLSLDFEPNVDGVEILGLAATIFDVLGDPGAGLGEISSWTVLNNLADLTGDLTTTDGKSLFGVNAGQLTQFGPFTDADPIDVIEFNWSTDQVGPYDVGYQTSTESMVIWQKDGNKDVGVDWAVVDVDFSFDVIPGQACVADCTGDGSLNILDFVCFQAFFVEQEPYADCDKNGQWNILDFVCFQGAFVAGCP